MLVTDVTSHFRTDFPQPKMVVSCLSDGVQVGINFQEQQGGFNGVLYVKGHSKDEQCRRVVTLSKDSPSYTEIFKVPFGKCGLIHVNVSTTFYLIWTVCGNLVILKYSQSSDTKISMVETEDYLSNSIY